MTGALERAVKEIRPSDAEARAAAVRVLDAKTKPRASLGRLEEIAARIAGIRRDPAPGRLRAAVVVAAADHGVALEGVSAYPQEVTRQMLANFEDGGAAVCVLARAAGASLRVIDAGVGTPTGNIAEGPAMSRADAVHWVEEGLAVSDQLARDGVGIVAGGEMGIANTTVAAALCAALLDVDPAATCGKGTGVDDAGLARKIDVVMRALRVNQPSGDPVATLAGLGGPEIAFLCGLTLGGAANRQVVLLDGFIATVAALTAARLAPDAADAMIAAHLSPEPGHRLALDALGLQPLIDLGLRLGEGSGAALALPILDASLAILAEMATFESAGVTDAGR